jgi:xanthine dehydrogenase accessory factor
MTSIYKALAKLEEEGNPGVLCTIIRSHGSTPRQEGSKMLVYPDGRLLGSVGGGELENRVIRTAMDALQDGKTRVLEYEMVDPERGDPGVCGGQLEVYVEPILPRPILVVIGAGHVGKAVAHLAKWLGFFVVASDDREGLCTPESISDADEYYPVHLSEFPDHFEITPWTYLVLTTRGVEVDVEGLPALLESQAAYIGLIGSKRRWAATRKELLESGLGDELLERVHSPIGLELNAETPEEIAVSIMAEILMLRRGGDGKPMRME